MLYLFIFTFILFLVTTVDDDWFISWVVIPLLGAVAVTTLVWFIYTPAPAVTTTTTTPIYSIGGNYNSITGTFVLGSGSINSEEQYSYFVKQGDALYKEYVPTSGTAIIESDVTPYVSTTECVKRARPELEWDTNLFEAFTSKNICPGTGSILYVPKNSVIQSFNIQ